jgi:hypothetical protein
MSNRRDKTDAGAAPEIPADLQGFPGQVAEARGFEPRMGVNPNRISSPFPCLKSGIGRRHATESAQVSAGALGKATEPRTGRRNPRWPINGPHPSLEVKAAGRRV